MVAFCSSVKTAMVERTNKWMPEAQSKMLGPLRVLHSVAVL